MRPMRLLAFGIHPVVHAPLPMRSAGRRGSERRDVASVLCTVLIGTTLPRLKIPKKPSTAFVFASRRAYSISVYRLLSSRLVENVQARSLHSYLIGKRNMVKPFFDDRKDETPSPRDSKKREIEKAS